MSVRKSQQQSSSAVAMEPPVAPQLVRAELQQSRASVANELSSIENEVAQLWCDKGHTRHTSLRQCRRMIFWLTVIVVGRA